MLLAICKKARFMKLHINKDQREKNDRYKSRTNTDYQHQGAEHNIHRQQVQKTIKSHFELEKNNCHPCI